MSRGARTTEEGGQLILAVVLSLIAWALLALFAPWAWWLELLLGFGIGFSLVYGGILIIAIADGDG